MCGNGVVDDGEDGDGGNLGDDRPNTCALPKQKPECEPGGIGCPCLVAGRGELPNNGLYGDGRYCDHDVMLGGDVRCVDDWNVDVCQICPSNGGWGCPCGAATGGNSCMPHDFDPPRDRRHGLLGPHARADQTGTGWDVPPFWTCDVHCASYGLVCADPRSIV